MRAVQRLKQIILQILFPAICISCSKYLEESSQEGVLCDECFAGININKEDPDSQVLSIGLYSSKALRTLIHELKFRRSTRSLYDIRRLIKRYLEANPDSRLTRCDLITFIPLHPKRERLRGFNQAELIAKTLGEEINIKVEKTLKRTRETKEQSSIKDFDQRLKNVSGCFSLLENQSIKNRNLILVDDICTSGSTTNIAREQLHPTGVRGITVFVLAKK